MAATTWTVTPSPSPSAAGNVLNGVGARTAADAWAVGSFTGPDGDAEGQNMLTAHWDGSTWRQVATPSVLHLDEVLSGVSADAADDAWAVGLVRSVGAAARSPLAAHWNGTAWSTVPVPNTTGTSKSVFNGVATVARDNAWAVGRAKNALALVEHWNGTAWSVVSVPQPTPPAGWTVTSANLTAISARSASDIWAVGSFNVNQSTNSQTRTLALHYDGTSWKLTPTPTNATTTTNTALNAVTAIAPNDAWSVGAYSNITGQTLPNQLVIQHWNGTSWTTTATPTVTGGRLRGVAARSATDVRAIGDFTDGSSTGGGTTLHWNGSTWSKESSPADTDGSFLTGVGATPGGGDLWATGSNGGRTVILRNTP